MGKQGSFLKRLTDILLSSLILLITSPIMLLSAIAIKLDSKGSILFIQERTGLKGQTFNLYKLRGMVTNAVMLGPPLTQINDPRITRVGKILRRTSIDEIPNFINVLKGEMSIVGPRPEILEITKNYNKEQREVFQFKPGITGFSQVNGRQMLTPEQRVKMEIEFYKTENFFKDIVILLKTMGVVISNSGNT